MIIELEWMLTGDIINYELKHRLFEQEQDDIMYAQMPKEYWEELHKGLREHIDSMEM